jgi:hypothetical protein
MIIEHRNNTCLTDADYFLQLGADLCFNPLLKEHVQQAQALRCQSPAPTDMPIAPEFQPYFCSPRLNGPKSRPTSHDLAMHTNVATIPLAGLQHLQNWPISFGCIPLSLDASGTA